MPERQAASPSRQLPPRASRPTAPPAIARALARVALVVLLATPALLAGCTDDEDAGNGDDGGSPIDTIVPGSWRVSNTTDHTFAWVHNTGNTTMQGAWAFGLAGGMPLPEGWTVSFNPASATLAPEGAAAASPQPTPSDWASTVATITVPARTEGSFDAEIRFGSLVKRIALTVDGTDEDVTHVGDRAQVNYDGRFADTGKQFDDGVFPLKLGSAGAIAGFSNGLLGLAAGEEVTLSMPPPFGYGYHQSDPSRTEFNGRTLEFTVSLESTGPSDAELNAMCAPFDGVADPRAPFPASEQDGVQVDFVTTAGNFSVVTDAEHAPQTVRNFLRYVDDGFYACTTFHRIFPGFVVQAGGMRPDGSRKETRDPIPLEATTEESNELWTLSMARTGDPDSATSQFFVNIVDNGYRLDPNANSEGYAVFGRVVSGFDNLTAMTEVTQGRQLGSGDFEPFYPIMIVHASRAET